MKIFYPKFIHAISPQNLVNTRKCCIGLSSKHIIVSLIGQGFMGGVYLRRTFQIQTWIFKSLSEVFMTY